MSRGPVTRFMTTGSSQRYRVPKVVLKREKEKRREEKKVRRRDEKDEERKIGKKERKIGLKRI